MLMVNSRKLRSPVDHSLFTIDEKVITKKKITMAVILPVEGKSPHFGKNCFIAPNATIVGDVIMGDDCSIWFNAVIRGDVNFICIGNKVNIQDGACIPVSYTHLRAHETPEHLV